MCPDVFIQVRLLCERGIAPEFLREWTGEGLFFGVDPHVVKEVVPFPEDEPASRVLTSHNLQCPFCFWILVFVDSESVSGGNMVV